MLWGKFSDPVGGIDEKVYFFDLKADTEGKVAYQLENPLISKGVKVSWNKHELPLVTEWKMMGQQDYVVAIEPGNCIPEGRLEAGKKNRLHRLKPGERYEIEYEIAVLAGIEAIDSFKSNCI